MNYNDLYREFISLFPEDKLFFDERSKETAAKEADGMHIMFGLVVVPFVKRIAKESQEKAKKAFEFFEKMEKSGNSDIAEVLEFTVLENLINDDNFKIYMPFFGNETKQAAYEIIKWFDVPDFED